MAEDPRAPSPPVAIRITRPYTTEDEFLEQELESLSRTSVTLLGAQPRPQGVVLRFELVLSSGHVLMRGEGRVVGFRPNMHQGLGGLTLRFTRLDSRSKALVDKATMVRERRRPSGRPDAESPLPSQPDLGRQPLPSLPESTPSLPTSPVDVDVTHAEVPAKRSEEPPSQSPLSPPPPAAAATPAPAGRDALLERLRSRAKALEPTAIQRILEQRRRQA